MVSVNEFNTALDGFVTSSAKAGAAADNVIGVAGVDGTNIVKGIGTLLYWAFKILTQVFVEIKSQPALDAKLSGAGKMLADNATLFTTSGSMKIMSSMYVVLNDLGLADFAGNILVNMIKITS